MANREETFGSSSGHEAPTDFGFDFHEDGPEQLFPTENDPFGSPSNDNHSAAHERPSYHQPTPPPMFSQPHHSGYYPGGYAGPTHFSSSSEGTPYGHPPQHTHAPLVYHHPYSGPNHSSTNSSSFESSGSSHGSPPYVVGNGGGLYMNYGYPTGPTHPGPGYHGHYYSWPAPQPVPLVSDIKPADVLSGRGGATNSHSGNRVFRSLVKQFQAKYLDAKKRDKPAVASQIVDLIRQKGGRFLRRAAVSNHNGEVFWIDIGDERAREKACQALREGAPTLRAKRGRGCSSSEDDEKWTSASDSDHKEPTLNTSSSSFERTTADKENDTRTDHHSDAECAALAHKVLGTTDEPVLIKPVAKLVRRTSIQPISLGDLTEQQRNLYLSDFMPPFPPIRQSDGKPQSSFPAGKQDESNPWPLVSV